MRHFLTRLGACMLVVGVTSLPAFAQREDQPRTQQPAQKNPQAKRDQSIRGSIVRVEGNDRFVVRTNDNREMTFYTDPQTRFQIDGKAARFGDFRVGAEINAGYTTRNDRFFLNSFTIGQAAEPVPARPREGGAAVQDTTTLRGRIIRLQAPDNVVVRNADGKEVALFTSPQTRYMINGKAVQFTDLKVGAEVNAEFIVRDGRHIVAQITVGGAPNEFQGTVVRVVGDDQVIVRTSDNKEITIYVQPQTKYIFDERAARFTDLRPGADIRIQYEERDRRRFAHSIFGPRRK